MLSTDDPVRVFERFSTLNAISNGRAEIIVGRGSFTESYPLFGYDMANYDELFEEHLNLFAELLKGGPITWKGRLRAPLNGARVYPETEGTLYTWSVSAGPRQSVARAAYYGLPLMLAIIGGNPARFAPYSQLYHEQLERFGKAIQPIGAHSPGHVAATDEQAKEELWPHYAVLMNRIGSERGWSPIGRDHFEREARRRGPLRRISADGRGEDRHHRQSAGSVALRFEELPNGTLPHDKLMTSIELYGTKVVPLVRDMLG